jgi:hypothetical protein
VQGSRWTWGAAHSSNFFFKKITPAPSCEVGAHAWAPLGVFTESSATWLSAKMDFFEFTPTPSYSSGATGRKSAPSPVAESSSSSSSSEEEEQEDDEVQGGGGGGGGGGSEAEGLYARPFNTFGATHTTREPPHY